MSELAVSAETPPGTAIQPSEAPPVEQPENPTTENPSLPGMAPAPENESSTPESAGKSSTVEGIKRAAGKVFEAFGVQYKKTGGRPRKDGKPNKGDIPVNVPATALPAGAEAPPSVPAPSGLDPVLVRRCCSAIVKAVSTFLDRQLFGKARIAGLEPKEAQQLVTDCSVSAEELNAFSELAEVALRKYGVGTEYAPEVGVAAIAVGVGLRYSMAIQDLNQRIAERKEARNGNAK